MKLVYIIMFLLLGSNMCSAVEDLYNLDNSENDFGDFKEVAIKEQSDAQAEDATSLFRTSTGSGSGVAYTRFGKISCYNEASLVYDGYAAAGWYSQKGNGANYLCMPKNPEYMSTTNVLWHSVLYGAEYQTNNQIFNKNTHDYNVPCAVCYRSNKSTKIMIPGKTSCPGPWSRQYFGYLMTSYHGHEQSMQYECVDSDPDLIPGSQSNTDGALFYFVQVECNRGLPCGPYANSRPVTCVVCTN